ncbi:hypothetical protein BL250_12555 [Erwinia sp. OLTSP20]|uniref:YqjK-like family protein n=1 Tax=unclassified Erwinia TaxID=2622719 RepID=UPI000C17EC24|nr:MULTISPECIES: YqjK-like family protein [unclassified Erwinia]PIJ50221.1 hypothetical protein BV501_09065 [Erwinia sp. OAMSP11]PIJ72058.1 hypothetical protein BK416_09965 [Erwinia sp. OLSSP12]PIJ81349.1 hypothetical protein BLD47_08790 [Erwinia sp. OLCASP19]PIJ84055.1 hypothetical protein BLD46_08370 [Erwinia sp. OLMTSP26]PIJ85754.1 hypothetical protein BLD49_09590 [Erwinia sp. OLMDSP33]
MSRREREQRKSALLRLIQQQRLDLSAECRDWQNVTARYDRSWLALMSLRRYIAIGSSLLAIWSVRHPRRMGRWFKRGLGIWSTWRLIRSGFPSR